MTGAAFLRQTDLLVSGQPQQSQLSITRVESVDFSNRGYLIALALIFAIGLFLRLPPGLFDENAPLHSIAALHPNSKWHEMRLVGVDEELYRGYVEQLSEKGLTRYPDIILGYIEKQLKLPGSILPPVRFLYILAGYLWHSIFRTEALSALKAVASVASMLTLAMAAALAWRMRGPVWSLAVMALVAFAPTQIHMSQHALVDGFFTFWALLTIWMLWENLQSARHWGWLIGYTLALAFLVLTKENSFFVWIAIVLVLIGNRWLRYGTVSAELLIATVLGPILGFTILVFLAGGVDILFGTYRLLISKNYNLPYAIKTGDGPWYRYLVDLLLVSPIVLLLAIGALFRIDRTKRPELFLLLFIGGSYLVMCNLKYGMNLRYANMWDMPLRFLAVGTLAGMVAPLRRSHLVFTLAIALICAIELRQYLILFVQFPLYELVSEGLLRALHILK
jgi:4-amino-4-deoxy-L-arabinose transferase-like glycosyltransferase